jgi:hypothetical protein
MFGPFKVAYTDGGIPFKQALEGKYFSTLNQISDGYTDNVVPALNEMKKLISDLPDNYQNYLIFSKRGGDCYQGRRVEGTG